MVLLESNCVFVAYNTFYGNLLTCLMHLSACGLSAPSLSAPSLSAPSRAQAGRAQAEHLPTATQWQAGAQADRVLAPLAPAPNTDINIISYTIKR